MTYHQVCNKSNTTDVGTATLPEHQSSLTIFSGVRVTQSLVFLCNVVQIVVCPFVPFLFAIFLSVLLRLTTSDYLPLVSCSHSVVCPSLISSNLS